MSILAVANIKGTNASGNVITLPTGHVLRSEDPGGIYVPGSITQTYQSVKTDTFSAAPNGSWTDITGLSVNITPKKTTSQILVLMNVVMTGSGTTPKIRLVRNGVAIGVGNAGSGQQQATFGSFLQVDANQAMAFASSFLDSPATTSVQTYKLQMNTDNTATIYVNRSVTDSANSTGGRYISSITVMEVAL